jgi:hypothetical protein
MTQTEPQSFSTNSARDHCYLRCALDHIGAIFMTLFCDSPVTPGTRQTIGNLWHLSMSALCFIGTLLDSSSDRYSKARSAQPTTYCNLMLCWGRDYLNDERMIDHANRLHMSDWLL